jgi:hypothetical protein
MEVEMNIRPFVIPAILFYVLSILVFALYR